MIKMIFKKIVKKDARKSSKKSTKKAETNQRKMKTASPIAEKPVILDIQNISVSTAGKTIIKNLSMQLKQNQIHVIMGPNGGGKSTLSYMIMGHPKYALEQGSITFQNEPLQGMKVDERARKGIFLGFQYPLEIPGVNLSQFLRTIVNNARKAQGFALFGVMEFQQKLEEAFEILKIPESFADRHLNEGFSGGEKKRSEILQLLLLQPKLAILDEPDSGLDIDSLKIVARGIKKAAEQGTTILLITHYQRLLNYVRPDFIHVLINGSIVREGPASLVKELENKGYDWLKEPSQQQIKII